MFPRPHNTAHEVAINAQQGHFLRVDMCVPSRIEAFRDHQELVTGTTDVDC